MKIRANYEKKCSAPQQVNTAIKYIYFSYPFDSLTACTLYSLQQLYWNRRLESWLMFIQLTYVCFSVAESSIRMPTFQLGICAKIEWTGEKQWHQIKNGKRNLSDLWLVFAPKWFRFSAIFLHHWLQATGDPINYILLMEIGLWQLFSVHFNGRNSDVSCA